MQTILVLEPFVLKLGPNLLIKTNQFQFPQRVFKEKSDGFQAT